MRGILWKTARSAAFALAYGGILLGLAAESRAGEFKRFLVQCPEKPNTYCPWFQAVVAPPTGWSIDEEDSSAGHVTMLTRDGHVTPKDAIMYILTGYDWHKQSLDEYVKASQEGWHGKVKNATVERLDDLKRDGKPTFQVYLYRNPANPKQAFELTAFTKDMDPANKDQSFFFQVVLTASSMEAITVGRPAFYDVLGKL